MAPAEDLDAFLTGVESKLRGPFSSLDLSKAISTEALRGSHTPKQYLELISKVLSRTDKVIQLRIIVGLLGLDPSSDTSIAIKSLLSQAQDGETHEEWVRTVSGLIQGIMFRDPADDPQSFDSKSCRGEEAEDLLQKTSQEILEQLENHLNNTEAEKPPDMNPHFAPHHFSLIEPKHLNKLIPFEANPHFGVAADASILHLDEQLEEQRAKEEHQHKQNVPQRGVKTTTAKSLASTSKAKQAAPDFPGFRKTSVMKSRVAAAKGPSMFMPTKKPLVSRTGRGAASAAKTGLHTRRAGAAQSLLSKNRAKQRFVGGTQKPMGSSTQGARVASQKSRMKMIDVAEVDTLNKEHQKREDTLKSRKRKILDAAAQRGLVQTKARKLEGTIKADKLQAGSSATAKNSNAPQEGQQVENSSEPNAAQQQQQQQQQPPSDNQKEWQVMLQGRSNRLSEEDKERIQHFFENQQNPSPDQDVYKMKLHEERTTDPNNGQAIKETFYLELDYKTFSSKQSKKTKRY